MNHKAGEHNRWTKVTNNVVAILGFNLKCFVVTAVLLNIIGREKIILRLSLYHSTLEVVWRVRQTNIHACAHKNNTLYFLLGTYRNGEQGVKPIPYYFSLPRHTPCIRNIGHGDLK